MTDFEPMLFLPPGPTNFDAPQQPFEPIPSPFQVIVPVSRTVRLDEVQGEAVVVPGTIYEHDYFLLHPIDGAIQRVWFASSLGTAQTSFSLQLVNDTGKELSAAVAYSNLPIVSTVLTEQVGAGAGGPVYLRVKAESQPARLFVTVELLVGEALQ